VRSPLPTLPGIPAEAGASLLHFVARFSVLGRFNSLIFDFVSLFVGFISLFDRVGNFHSGTSQYQ